MRRADATFDADVVISAVGIRLNLDLAASMGCAVDHGVVVDTQVRTSVPDVYAVGDIAEWPCRYVAPLGEQPAPYRAEHYNVALGHGAAAASAIVGGARHFALVAELEALGHTGIVDDEADGIAALVAAVGPIPAARTIREQLGGNDGTGYELAA